MPYPPELQRLVPSGVPAEAVSVPQRGAPDGRMAAAWRSWLDSLARDSAAATAAAHLYGELSAAGRDAWLDALEEDVPRIQAAPIAAYGPLFSVEDEPARLARMRKAVKELPAAGMRVRRALHGSGADGINVAVLVLPLYLQFVRVLCFRFRPNVGFDWAKQQPFALDSDAPRVGDEIDGVRLNRSCAVAVVDELAHAVLAEKRNGGQAPLLLHRYASLFSAHVQDETEGVVVE